MLIPCVKVVQIQSFSGQYFPVFGLNTGKYGPEKTPYLDTFHAVKDFTWSVLKEFSEPCQTSNMELFEK